MTILTTIDPPTIKTTDNQRLAGLKLRTMKTGNVMRNRPDCPGKCLGERSKNAAAASADFIHLELLTGCIFT